MVVLLIGEQASGVADGEDTDARRFYESHGFTITEPNQTDPMLYYYREL